MGFFLILFLFLATSQLQYTDMASCISWTNGFSLQSQTFGVFYGYLGLTELEIYL
jgi:hypothetical protein